MDELPRDLLENRFPGGFTVRDEANAIVAYAFRNGPLEDLHAGKHSELLEDKSLSRISDAEMKTLMLTACDRVEHLLRQKQSDPKKYMRIVTAYNVMYCGDWRR
jgi:hypothetical protein